MAQIVSRAVRVVLPACRDWLDGDAEGVERVDMAMRYLDTNTVIMSLEHWMKCGEFYMNHSFPIQCLECVALPIIKFLNLPETYPIWAKVSLLSVFPEENTAALNIVARWTQSVSKFENTMGIDATINMNVENMAGKIQKLDYLDRNNKPLPVKYPVLQPRDMIVVQLGQICLNFVFMNYLCIVDKKAFDIEVKEIKKNPCKKNSLRKRKEAVSVVHLFKQYSLRKEYDISDKNPIIRSCRLWEVRGHIRHYKDGREVYIKPYLKGADRFLPEAVKANVGKEYRVRKGALQSDSDNT